MRKRSNFEGLLATEVIKKVVSDPIGTSEGGVYLNCCRWEILCITTAIQVYPRQCCRRGCTISTPR